MNGKKGWLEMSLSYCLHCFGPLRAAGFCERCGFNNGAYRMMEHHLMPGTVIRGRYLIGRVLGEGGFGITYAGFDGTLKRRVAVKEFFPRGIASRFSSQSLTVNCQSSEPTVRESFSTGITRCLNEAQILAQLDSVPAIVRVLDFFRENNTAYIVMEFVEGVTLRDYLSRLPARMNFAQAQALMAPVGDALWQIHARGLVHRDISPDNIMLTKDGRPKLLDFGAAKLVFEQGGKSTQNPIIKRGFSPLEMYSTQGKIGPWSDVYAYCATLYYLFVGSPPEEPMERMENDPVPARLAGMLPPAQAAVMMRGLSIQIGGRFKSMEELHTAFGSVWQTGAGAEKKQIYQQNNKQNHTQNHKRNNKTLPLVLVATTAVIMVTVFGFIGFRAMKNAGWFSKDTTASVAGTDTAQTQGVAAEPGAAQAEQTSGVNRQESGVNDFDLRFLKLENSSRNVVYCPLAIKLGLSMMLEAAGGDTREQISQLIDGYEVRQYLNNDHFALFNGLYVQGLPVNDAYKTTVLERFNADVLEDNSGTVVLLNEVVKNKTLGQISTLFRSNDVPTKSFVLGNALAVDMDWTDQLQYIVGEDRSIPPNYNLTGKTYPHENYVETLPSLFSLDKMTFADQQDVPAALISASFNNCDLVGTMGEDTVRSTVTAAYEEWLLTDVGKETGDPVDSEEFRTFMDEYITDLKANYGKNYVSTSIAIYNDGKVKAFSKDLKEYSGTELRYVAIMPKTTDLASYIEALDANAVREIIGNLRELKNENFTDGVLTKVTGRIPVYQYQYTLDLTADLKAMGLTDAFDAAKADFSGLTPQNGAFLSSGYHSAAIIFSNDGIRAAAKSADGGFGDGDLSFDYRWDVPIEEIDMTIDRPFLYVILDKNTGEVWFVGAVYAV